MSALGLGRITDMASVQHNFDRLEQTLGVYGQLADFIGTGDPNGTITASPGATYRDRAGGAATTLYVKETGVNTNTGWVGK